MRPPQPLRPSALRGQVPYLLMLAPLVMFVLVTVVVPVALFLFRAIDNRELQAGFPQTAAALSGWSQAQGLPPEPAFAALIFDLAKAQEEGRAAALAARLNQAVPGSRSTVIKTAKWAATADLQGASLREDVLDQGKAWHNPALWSVIAHETGRFTSYYILTTLDLKRGPEGQLQRLPAEEALFLTILARTLAISLSVTAICALLALPVAHVITAARPRMATLLLAMVLLPLWTSLLVRTVAWIILLQGEGPVNATLQWLGAVTEPLRLVYTRGSLIVTMVQVLLPLMILPVLAVLKRIPPEQMRAARSLGAPWWMAWRRVQLPLLWPGLMTGAGLTFTFALGYYITPRLIGGEKDQMLSSFIVFYTDKTLNWGLAAALSLQLLVILALVAGLLAGLHRLTTGRVR
ncbi:ABC transporter permease [Xinfangfangia sp. CPCC 101601]|uniref:ABC transporter permease n=1 Tax=Pseudogemmobacter lacusdianii TaxID=3069608 RepID=A0ABU0VVW9_9RHOB|nr:ABC transporter permease [Xinfangfangia sp. CPCC 101601]MDQ2065897.1 ABC transporter permease [Xinfangfangia sp. CPCC 101601]